MNTFCKKSLSQILRTRTGVFRPTSTASISTDTSNLKIYGHYVSQPARAVAWLCRMNDIDYDFVRVQPMLGDCKKPEYLEKFPTGLSPAIEDGGDEGEEPFRLAEGQAILQYLAEKHGLEQWYPTAASTESIQKRANIHAYLSSHHSTTRQVSKAVFFNYMRFIMNPRKNTFDKEDAVATATAIASEFDRVWLTSTGVFISGCSDPTIADLLAYCEIAQASQMGICDYKGLPRVQKWLQAMQSLPFHDDVHSSLFKLRENYEKSLLKK